MTIKQVEPLKFKGNKTWYLHKLSEKGADAIKCDFPNGDDTFTETTLQAAIDELATNGGGGGSAESLIPKRVIYINPDKETVAGECYPTFAAAKTYMETYPEQRFCVELPAGDFGTTADDHITLSEQWEIHGNKTKIVAPIDTKIVETGNMQGVYNTSRSIQNCTISEGFVVDTGATGIKCYHVFDCVILKMSTDTGDTATTAAILAHNSTIKTGDESETSTTWSIGLFKCCFVQNFNAKIGTDAGLLFICCEIVASNTHAGKVTYSHCSIIGPGGSAISSTETPVLDLCNLSSCKLSGKPEINKSKLVNPNIDDITELHLIHCDVQRAIVSENKTLTRLLIKDSYFHYEDTDSNSSTLTITTLYSDAISLISATNSPKLVIPTRNMNIVYSTDGGTTISNDPTGATHYGICKNLARTLLENSNYMWFPMPE